MSAIDSNMSQLVELPIDQAGAYVIQDASGVIPGGSIQLGNIQGGKSLLKPELAQHLNQHTGYKSTVGRGGFTLSGNDPRWVSLNNNRTARNVVRKPLGSNTSHIQSGLGVSQSNVLAPAASGLLSLGTRYTPSSASAFGSGTGSLSGSTGGLTNSGTGMLAPATASGNMVSANVGTLGSIGVDRDAGYRLSAAIAGTSGRGRPRGRRPLRGQFPVVPIDMVRQLGIEQQVILQPAAPVAMRNKAVLCRPLSLCRKTQANVVQVENVCHPTNMGIGVGIQTDKIDIKIPLRSTVSSSSSSLSDKLVLENECVKHDKETQTMELIFQDNIRDNHDNIGCDGSDNTNNKEVNSDEPSYVSLGTSTLDDVTFQEIESQTDTVEEKEKPPLILPIPIPVPIYVPFPVCLYARPVPFLLTYPLPCPIPMPLAIKAKEPKSLIVNEESYSISIDSNSESQPLMENQIETGELSDSHHSGSVCSEQNDSLVISSENIIVKSNEHSNETCDLQITSSLKRSTPSSSPEHDSSLIHPESNNHLITTQIAVLESQQHNTSSSISWESGQPAPKRPRQNPITPIITSDANYHLKFSYGINAWRHWIQQKLGSVDKSRLIQQHSHSYTDLLNMSDADLSSALSQFVREVRKPNNECYVADSIFYLCLGIQEYLNEHGRLVNLFGSPAFASFSRALDEILANFQPRISAEGLLICRIEEEHLWEARQLGSESPEVLLFTMLYYNTKHFGLRLGTVHRQLSFSQFHQTESTVLCHLPSSIFGGPNDSLTTFRLDINHEHPQRCPVRLFKTYIANCPAEIQNSDELFYLVPNYSAHLDIWYSKEPMESPELQVMLNRIKMVKEIQEAFMNGQPDGGF